MQVDLVDRPPWLVVLGVYGGYKPMGFPTKSDDFGLFWGVPPFKETPIYPPEV